jgi:hypothetical protein
LLGIRLQAGMYMPGKSKEVKFYFLFNLNEENMLQECNRT